MIEISCESIVKATSNALETDQIYDKLKTHSRSRLTVILLRSRDSALMSLTLSKYTRLPIALSPNYSRPS